MLHSGANQGFGNSLSKDGGLGSGSLLSDKYQKPNLLKPLFLVFNTLAYIAYIITILAFILSKNHIDGDSDVIDDSSWLSTFYRIVSGINGLCFFLLTVSLLNYGSRLEKIVTAIKLKRQHARAT